MIEYAKFNFNKKFKVFSCFLDFFHAKLIRISRETNVPQNIVYGTLDSLILIWCYFYYQGPIFWRVAVDCGLTDDPPLHSCIKTNVVAQRTNQ
jgi:hypothetical protein